MTNYWITVVDDDAMSMANTRNMLAERNMRVNCLRSGTYFMKFIQNNTPDLVLLDIMMPGTDGFQTYHDLRSFEKQTGRDPVPVIFLSSENPSETVPYGLKIGAADYVSKPCDPVVLMSRIERAIESSRMIKGLISESEHDKLTGFLNKNSGTKKTAELCSTKPGALLMIDLDSFKLVNDIYGHETGDQVLVLFADTIRKNIRANDVVCRVGGDEFMAFLADVDNEETAAFIIRRLNDLFVSEAEKLMADRHDIPLGISAGMALMPLHSTDFETLFRYADEAMYKVKRNGKHGFAMYEPDRSASGSTVELDKELARLVQIFGERGNAEGAMFLGNDAFTANFRFLMRFIRHNNLPASQIIISVLSSECRNRTLGTAEKFGDFLQKSLRICDIMTQSGSSNFLVLLPEKTEQDAEETMKRIISSWEKDNFCEEVTISYYIKNVLSYK